MVQEKALGGCLVWQLIQSVYKIKKKVETKDCYWKIRISIDGLCQCCMQVIMIMIYEDYK